MKTLVNAAGYQTIWFIAVLGHNDIWWLALVLIAGHFLITHDRITDLKTALCLVIIGIFVDGLLKYFGFFNFSADRFPLPYWLMTIWAALALTLHHSLSWFKLHPYYAALFAAIGGPLAYWAGVRFGAATFQLPTAASLLILALAWGILFPLMTQLAQLLRPSERS